MSQSNLPRDRRALFVFIAFSGLLVACNGDPTARKQKFYDRGVEFLKKGKPKQAVLEFRNALQIDPTYPDANNVLAEILFSQGGYQEAYELLKRASAADRNYLPARKGLAQMYRLSGKMAEAEAEIRFVLDRSPRDLDALMTLGFIQQRQDRFQEAEATFGRVLEIRSDHVNAFLALASLKQETVDLPAAERYLKLALEHNPGSTPVYLSLISFYITTGRPREAESLFSEGLQITNNNPEMLLAQANYYIEFRQISKAEAVVKTVHSFSGNDPKYRTVLADFYAQIDQSNKAKAELELILQQHPDDRTAMNKLIEVLLTLNDRRTAEDLNDRVLKENPKDAHAHLVKGRLALTDGRLDEAFMHFNATKAYEADLPALHYWYAQAYQVRGQLDQAKLALATALKLDPKYQTARLSLAELQNRTHIFDGALSNARTVLLRNPNNIKAMLIYSQALISTHDYVQAGKVLKLVAEKAPNEMDLHRQLGILYFARKNMPAARQEFTLAWNALPNSQDLLEDLLRTYLTDNQTGPAVDFLQKQLQLRPQDSLLHHELAQVYLLQKKQPEAITALIKALSLESTRMDSATLLASLYIANQQSERAVSVITDMQRKAPQNSAVLMRAGMLFEKVARWDEARKAYEGALQIDKTNAIAKNNLAWILAEHDGNIDVALGLAQQAKEALGDDPQVTHTIGWIYYKKGIYQMALVYLKACAQGDPQNALLQYQLGLTYAKAGSPLEARQALQNALALDPNFSGATAARKALAEL